MGGTIRRSRSKQPKGGKAHANTGEMEKTCLKWQIRPVLGFGPKPQHRKAATSRFAEGGFERIEGLLKKETAHS
jgi:hypothetical protein